MLEQYRLSPAATTTPKTRLPAIREDSGRVDMLETRLLQLADAVERQARYIRRLESAVQQLEALANRKDR